MSSRQVSEGIPCACHLGAGPLGQALEHGFLTTTISTAELSPGAALTFPTLSLALRRPQEAVGIPGGELCGARLILISPFFCELEVALTSLMVTALRTGQWAKEGAGPVLRRLARRLPRGWLISRDLLPL